MVAVKYIVVGVVLVVGVVVGRRMVRRTRRKKWLAEPIKPEWKVILEKNVPLYKLLPGKLKGELEGLLNVFLSEKSFEGCGGQEITDEVRVTIAGQACMLLLNRKTRYFPKLHTIYVYPATFVFSLVADGITGGMPRQG